ncbi:hypothetical protein [Gracilimonas sp. BCB1]|uniref:hypothetical protein n=1 Tax=Gracilimonas sp. BCB1 TaxID=3152362 RepID=UPI0032D98637
MKFFFLLAAISICAHTVAFSQIEFEEPKEEIQDRNPPISSVYLDLLGNAYTYSLNYDYIGKENIGFRFGITPYFDLRDSDDLPPDQRNDKFSQSFLLVGMGNYYFGDGVHRLETGLGAVLSVNDQNIRPGLPDYPALTGTVGYRILPNRENITIRIAFTPILSKNKFYPHFGFSFGYIFN